jgi:hypothetical protein
MATISNTPRPGYAWDSTDNCWYPIGVGQHSHGEIPASTVDAKGDILVGTANDTVSKRSVGVDGSVLIADSTQATGLNWAGLMQYAGKNKVINGDFSIWQRGTSFSPASNGAYHCDRFLSSWDGNGSIAITRQAFTAGSAPVTGYEGQYFIRSAYNTVGTTTVLDLNHRIEDVRTFAGQTITLSFWAKADTARTCYTWLIQQFGGGGSADAYTGVNAVPFSVTSSWQRFTFTATLPSVAGKTIGTNSWLLSLIRIPAAAGAYLDIWGLQLEAGSVATPFVPAGGGSQQAELALCQRYYYRHSAANAGDAVCNFVNVAANSTVNTYGNYKFKTVMRTSPSFSASGNFQVYGNGTAYTATAIAQERSSTDSSMVRGQVSSGLTSGYAYWIEAQSNNTCYMEWSAEL